jgi:peptide deformylase
MNLVHPCPCGSHKEYDVCCRLFHRGGIAENALLLMRSRYSAYVLNIPEYIVLTTHPASPQYSDDKFSWKRSISQFSRGSSFHRLEILDFKEQSTLATVTFTVHLSQKGKDATFTERSHFEKIGSRWFYRTGQLVQGRAPNLVTMDQLKMLPLAYYGDAVLRKKAEPIFEMTSDLKKLVEEMIETMDACEGIGLAAPQVHHSLRLFVIRIPIETDSEGIELGEVKVFINPKLTSPSEETWEAPEGCLSIPTFRAPVKRPKEITVEYTSLDGTLHQERVSGWQAKVIMHENDHIDGVLFIDHLDPKLKESLKPFLQSLEKRIHDGRAL